MSDMIRLQPTELIVRVQGKDPALVDMAPVSATDPKPTNPDGSFDFVMGFRADINAAANMERMQVRALMTGVPLDEQPTNAVADMAHCFHSSYHQARDQRPAFTRDRFGAYLGYAFHDISEAVTELSAVLRLASDGEPGEAPDPRDAESAKASG